jgi:hypothetical protein
VTRNILALGLLAFVAACDSTPARGRGDGGGGGGGDGGNNMNIPNCDPAHPPSQDSDQDQDGYTPAMGDCNDCNKSINPGAIQIPNDPTDYACNGMPGVVVSCDSTNGGKTDATSLAQAFEQCDSRFFKSAMFIGPSGTNNPMGRTVTGGFGSIKPVQGANMALLSTGYAVDQIGMPSYNPEQGASLGDGNNAPNPLPNIPDNPLCASAGGGGGMSCQPSEVHDYTELVLKLKAPSNVNSFTFQFQFFSAEYPEFVCTQFNDEFLVLQESNGEFQTASNISFDSSKNPITVNNGLFTVCKNGSMSYDKNCKQPVSMLAGTGYEGAESTRKMAIGNQGLDPPNLQCLSTAGGDTVGQSDPIGGSTGWLVTTSPVTPGEDVTLHFIIFDEGDHIYDSAVLIDNFVWGTSVVSTPTTNPIQ